MRCSCTAAVFSLAGSGRGDVYPGLGVCLSSFSVLRVGDGLQPKDLARLDAGGTRFSVAMMTTSGHAHSLEAVLSSRSCSDGELLPGLVIL